jgi:hypothetical protein
VEIWAPAFAGEAERIGVRKDSCPASQCNRPFCRGRLSGSNPPHALSIRAVTKGRRRCFRCFCSEFTASGARSAAEILERVGSRAKITAHNPAVLRCFPLFAKQNISGWHGEKRFDCMPEIERILQRLACGMRYYEVCVLQLQTSYWAGGVRRRPSGDCFPSRRVVKKSSSAVGYRAVGAQRNPPSVRSRRGGLHPPYAPVKRITSR